MADPIYDNQKDPTSDKASKDKLHPMDGPSLDEQENATPKEADGGKKLSTDQLKQAESNSNWLFAGDKNGPQTLPLRQRIKNISARRKAFSVLGVGGIVSLILAIFTIGPIFRIPSIMSGLLDKVGARSLDVVEDRGQRLIMSYLIQAAGGNPNDYVVLDSPVATLWASFRVNKLEDKIYKQTGLKIVNEDGKILLKLDHDDRELLKTQIKNYDDIVKLLDNPNLGELSKKELRKAMRTIVRTTVPLWRYKYSGKMANYMRIKHGVRFDAPHYDPSKTRAENAEAFRKRMIDSVSKQTVGRINSVMNCITNLDCEDLKQGNKPIEPKDAPKAVQESGNKIADATQEAYPEARDEMAKTDPVKTKVGFSEKLKERMALKLATSATVVGAAVESIVMMTHLWKLASEVSDSDLAAGGINALMVEDSAGAQFSEYQGYASNIQAGRMHLFYISMLNGMIAGGENSATYKYTYTGQTGNGVPVEDRVNNDFNNPALAFYKYYQLSPNYHINNAIFTALGAVIDVTDAIGGFLLDLILNKILQFDELMKVIFGEKWEEEFYQWAIDGIIKFLGFGVDPLATGAKLFNQLYVGGDALLNTYCRTNLGCRALSDIKNITIDNFDVPIIQGPGAVLPDKKLDVAVLPLYERLFSLDEPRSLLNEGIRAIPNSNNPLEWTSGILQQVGAIPSQLFGLVSGHSLAVPSTTPNQDAAVSGTRQYGMTAQDLAQDIAPEVRQQKTPVCPEVDQEKTANICKADNEVVGMLMCDDAAGNSCPEYGIGHLDSPGTANSLWANLRQFWNPRQTTATW